MQIPVEKRETREEMCLANQWLTGRGVRRRNTHTHVPLHARVCLCEPHLFEGEDERFGSGRGGLSNELYMWELRYTECVRINQRHSGVSRRMGSSLSRHSVPITLGLAKARRGCSVMMIRPSTKPETITRHRALDVARNVLVFIPLIL